MEKNKTSISRAASYQEIGEFWDNHDLTDFWEKTEPVKFEVDIKSVRKYFPINRDLSEKVVQIAQKQGVSPETLLNLWIQEKVSQFKID